jgi:hypothetical protein
MARLRSRRCWSAVNAGRDHLRQVRARPPTARQVGRNARDRGARAGATTPWSSGRGGDATGCRQLHAIGASEGVPSTVGARCAHGGGGPAGAAATAARPTSAPQGAALLMSRQRQVALGATAPARLPEKSTSPVRLGDRPVNRQSERGMQAKRTGQSKRGARCRPGANRGERSRPGPDTTGQWAVGDDASAAYPTRRTGRPMR